MLRKDGTSAFLNRLPTASRLLISFVMISAVFLSAALYSSYAFIRRSAQHDYLLDHVMARTIKLFDFRQELTEMGHLIETTFLSPEWQASADEAEKLRAQARFAKLHRRLLDSGDSYIAMLLSDTRIDENTRTVAAGMMAELLDYVNVVYDRYRLGAFPEGDAPDFAANAGSILEELRGMYDDMLAYARSHMGELLVSSFAVKFAALGIALIVATVTTYLMISGFRKKIKLLDKMAGEVRKGNFDVGIKTESGDEIGTLSHTIAGMAETLKKLTMEIYTVSTEIGMGNTGARIDETVFEGGYKDAAVAINSLAEWALHVSTFLQEAKSNERIQLMFDSAPVLIEYWDQDIKYIECNHRAIDTFGVSSKQEYKERYSEFIPELQPDGTPSWEALAGHLKKALAEGASTFEFECQKPNGEPVFFEVIALRMTFNDEAVVVTYSKDVSALIETQGRIREADERTQLMLDGMPIACYLLDKDCLPIDCNNEAMYMFNFGDKNAAVKNFAEVFLRRNPESTRRHFDKALETGFHRFECELLAPSGEAIPCEITFVRFSLRKEYVVAAYMFDLRTLKGMIEEMKRVEIAEENSLAKSKFLARMSHEIRTPISAVLGISEIQLQKSGLPSNIEEAFSKIFSSSRILLGIINDLLDLSKIEAGKMDILHEEYAAASLINDIVQLNLVRLGSKKIRFAVDIDENTPKLLSGDELRIKQILNNLLSNAFKYTDSGSVEFSLQSRTVEGSDDVKLAFTIADTGRGMSREQVESLHNEYTRFNEAENRYVEGTGLGMAIVYSLVQMMEGAIHIDSEIGRGTKIVVTITQKSVGAEILGRETVGNIQNLEAGRHSVAKKPDFEPEPMPYGSVLVVDDVETNVYVAKGLLSFYGLNVETCSSGLEAVNKIAGGKTYDIVFMDQMMPNMNGTEATGEIRRLGYAGPVIALTANALIGQAEEFLRSGFDGFISKPIDTAHLNGILNRFIRDRQPAEVVEAARNGAGRKSSPANGDTWSYFSGAISRARSPAKEPISGTGCGKSLQKNRNTFLTT